MNTTKRSLSLAGFAGFLAGCAVMYLVWPRGMASAKISTPAPHGTVKQTQTEDAGKSPRTVAQTAQRGAEARLILNEIKRNKIADVNIRFFATPNGKLSQQFINFFDLTPAEVSELSDLIQTTRTEMWKAANAQAQVAQTDTGGVVVRIPPAAAGPDIYDKVMDGFQSVLGDERFKDMMLYDSHQISYLFNQFGGEKRTVTIEPGKDGRYNIGINHTEPAGGSVSQTMGLTLDEIKEYHPEWVEFVPVPTE